MSGGRFRPSQGALGKSRSIAHCGLPSGHVEEQCRGLEDEGGSEHDGFRGLRFQGTTYRTSAGLVEEQCMLEASGDLVGGVISKINILVTCS